MILRCGSLKKENGTKYYDKRSCNQTQGRYRGFIEGKTLQFKKTEDASWIDCENPFFAEIHEYRIKPQPRHWWITFIDKSYMVSNQMPGPIQKWGTEIIEVVEVMKGEQ